MTFLRNVIPLSLLDEPDQFCKTESGKNPRLSGPRPPVFSGYPKAYLSSSKHSFRPPNVAG
jgi:hypothetical protein